MSRYEFTRNFSRQSAPGESAIIVVLNLNFNRRNCILRVWFRFVIVVWDGMWCRNIFCWSTTNDVIFLIKKLEIIS